LLIKGFLLRASRPQLPIGLFAAVEWVKRKGRRDCDGPSSHRMQRSYLARPLRFAGVFRFAGVLVRAARAVATFFVFFAM